MGTLAYFKYSPYENFEGRRVLNLGCGFAQYRASNVTNLDAEAHCKPDVVWDLAKTPLPFADSTFDHIFANHVMEHVPNWWALFNDCARILKPGGKLEIWVPGYGSDSALGYRDHINLITQESFCGCYGVIRAGGNAWADRTNLGWSNWLKPGLHRTRTINAWWIKYSPWWFKLWCVRHLRNCSEEEGFFFQKATPHEYGRMMAEEEKRKNANKNTDGNRAVPVSQMRQTGVHEPYRAR